MDVIQRYASERYYAWKIAAFHITRKWLESVMTIVAIGIACGLFIAMALFIQSFQTQVKDWIVSSTKSQYYLQSPPNSIPQPYPMPRETLIYLKAHDSVENIETISRRSIQFDDQDVMLVINDYDALRESQRLLLIQSHETFSWETFKNEHVFVSEAFARKMKKGVGDRIVLPGTLKSTSFMIMGIYKDYATEKGIIMLSQQSSVQLFGEVGDLHGISFDLSHSDTDLVLDELTKLFLV